MSQHEGVQNLSRYKNCFCNRIEGDTIVELREFPYGETGEVYISGQEVVFMTQGSARLVMEGQGAGRIFTTGDFIFLPAGSRIAYSATEHSSILIVRVPHDLPECPVFRMDRARSRASMAINPEGGIHTLKVNDRVATYVSELLRSLEDGFTCRHFMRNEASRLMFIVNAYYPEAERVEFFSHITTPDMKFSEFVRMNHAKYGSVGELAEALRMSPQAFSARFKKVFGTTPHKWSLREKARNIYRDICRTDMPLKEIAAKYEFPLSSNFFRFCKQTFGESPGNIRKQKAPPVR